MQSSETIAAIILAAGSSSRMGAGRHKLFLPLGEQPVLVHVITAALAAQTRPVILVLGHQAAQARALLSAYLPTVNNPASTDTTSPIDTTAVPLAGHNRCIPDRCDASISADLPPGLQIIENPAYQQGMSTSLRAGLQALDSGHTRHLSAEQIRIGGAIILLGDQPLITATIIDTLVATWRTTRRRIVAPLYNGKRGNPVLFSSELFTELAEVTGDEGGRRVIERHRDDIAMVEVEDARANFDVDTWEAYQQVILEWQQQQEKM